MCIRDRDRDISLKRIMEVHPLPPKKSLGLQIPAGVSVESASVKLKTPDMKWAKVFISMDGKSWAEVPLKEDGSADIGGVNKEGVPVHIAEGPDGGVDAAGDNGARAGEERG